MIFKSMHISSYSLLTLAIVYVVFHSLLFFSTLFITLYYWECVNWWMMNRFYGMVDRRKLFSLISSRDHCQRSSPSRISDTPRAGFEPAQNLSSGFVEWSCVVVITTAPRRHCDENLENLGWHFLCNNSKSTALYIKHTFQFLRKCFIFFSSNFICSFMKRWHSILMFFVYVSVENSKCCHKHSSKFSLGISWWLF